jgi:predicted house-cleaning NTP pyrophosphatase (Maf/HAM1 superfamily)
LFCFSIFVWFQTADIDEKSIRRENPDDLVMVLAEAKVGTGFAAVRECALQYCDSFSTAK